MVMKQLVSPIDEIYVNILYNSVIEHSRILTTTSECSCTVRFLTYILLWMKQFGIYGWNILVPYCHLIVTLT